MSARRKILTAKLFQKVGTFSRRARLILQLTMDATLANQITSLDEARALITQLRADFQQSLTTLQTENKLLLRQSILQNAFTREF